MVKVNSLLLEEELISKIDVVDKKLILIIYKKLYDCFISNDLGNGLQIRSVKNHLILLNQSLYNHFYDKEICKNYLYDIRNKFICKIEKINEEAKLYKLGQKIIIKYSNVLTEKCYYARSPIICKAITYINNHIDDDLSLEKVADSIHVSKNYLSSIFVKNIGYSFSSYINKIKIENSKLKLRHTTKSILNISMECGFNSQTYFCSIFKKFTGITPNEYRKKQLIKY